MEHSKYFQVGDEVRYSTDDDTDSYSATVLEVTGQGVVLTSGPHAVVFYPWWRIGMLLKSRKESK